MSPYILIALSCFLSVTYAEYDPDRFVFELPSTTEIPMTLGEREINRTDDGHCIFEITKRKVVVVPVQYTDIETYLTRCRGYYFKKCLSERKVVKTRNENQVREFNETVSRCCDGYAQNNDKCLPTCEHSCVYGSCTAPNKCTCYDGYELKANSSNICTPKCVGCTHGTCIAPNICACSPGYNWNSQTTECVPVCNGGCHNGECVSPGQCHCNEGFINHPTESICLPHCNESCVNGECIAPNKCECYFEYKFANGSQSVCEPICEMSCKNAKCVEPNVCECQKGYTVLNDDKPHECHCGLYCVEIEGMCHCLDDDHRVNGDVIRNNITSICSENNCLHGVCLTPYDCECFDGFEKDANQVCVAVNDTCIDDDPNNCGESETRACNCINGVCYGNNTCFCVNGFKKSEDQDSFCEPQCSKDCINGFCINPDECECHVGYRLGYNESETHICHPICDPDIEDNNGCYNGTCVAPDTCQCYEGFELTSEGNFTCFPIPFYFERQTSKINWIMGSGLGVIIVALLLGAAYSVNKYRLRNFNAPKRDDEASEPITGYVSEEL